MRVRSLHPGTIATRLTQHDPEIAAFIRPTEEAQSIPRIGELHEIANVIAFIASDAASLCAGAALVADGGWSIA